MNPGTAYIDMEFAGIYGTHQRIQVPTEIGVVIHQPDSDAITFNGKAFTQNINVERWKNITDDVGKRITGQRRIFNLASPGQSRIFTKRFHLNRAGQKDADRAIAGVHTDIRHFMQALNDKEIGILVFFARRREMETFRCSKVRTDDFLIRDLQEEIRSCFQLKEHVSLDRMSLVTRIGITTSAVSSAHFSYSIPEKFRYLIKPHKAIGDAARMFLVDCEFHEYPEEFGERLKGHLEEYEHRKGAKNPALEKTG